MFDLSDLNSAAHLIASSIESEDRRKRRKVVDELSKEFTKYNAENPELISLFDAVRHVLWNCINDKAETVRDATIDMLLDIFQKIPCNNKYLEEIIPVLLFRLEDQENKDPSEEIRLKLVELLKIIIEKYTDNIEPYAGDIVQSLAHTLVDKYPKLRQESARCCIALSKVACYSLYENSCKLVKPIIESFKHNHSKTRILAVEALSYVLKEANWKNVQAQFVFGSLGERIFDDVPGVRMAVVELLGLWLLQLRDRYSFFWRMVPLMLSCLSDKQPEVMSRAWAVWNAAGRLFLSENEQDLKDKMNFLDEKPIHYPPGVERPNLGCRTLVQRHTSQIITPLVQELTDWQPAVCAKASSVLALLVLHAEAELTQHTETLLLSLYRVAEDKGGVVPTQCRSNIDKAAEYMGYFISPATWHQLVFPIVEAEPLSGNLFVLASLLRGTSPTAMEPYAERLTKLLADRNICESLKVAMQLETLKCCRAFLDNVTVLPLSAIQNMLICLYQVTAITRYDSEKQPLTEAGQDCIALLAEKSQTDVATLTKENIMLLVSPLHRNVDAWSTAHPHFRLLLLLLAESGAVWLAAKYEVLEVLGKALQLDKGDVEVKSHLFARLASIFTIGDKEFSEFTLLVINDFIIPNLTWRAGLSAERLRTVVLACLVCITRNIGGQTDKLKLPCDALIPVLVGSVRDTPAANRKYALECMDKVSAVAAEYGELTAAMITNMYPQVIDRIDDVDNEVRICAIATLHTVFLNIPSDMTEATHSAVFGHIVNAMLPYLDDDSEIIRKAVCEALKIFSTHAPNVTKDKLTSRKHLFKSQELCSELSNHLEALLS